MYNFVDLSTQQQSSLTLKVQHVTFIFKKYVIFVLFFYICVKTVYMS